MPPLTYVKPRGYQQITVSTTAVGLTVPAGASRAIVVVEAQPIRYRDDGTDPTSSVGMLCQANLRFELESQASMLAFKAIRQGASDATLSVSYYK